LCDVEGYRHSEKEEQGDVSLNKCQALLMHKTVKTEYFEHGIGTLLSEM